MKMWKIALYLQRYRQRYKVSRAGLVSGSAPELNGFFPWPLTQPSTEVLRNPFCSFCVIMVSSAIRKLPGGTQSKSFILCNICSLFSAVSDNENMPLIISYSLIDYE